MYESMKSAIQDGIEYAETGPQLVYNEPVQRLWKHLNYFNHKRRVCYVKPIKEAQLKNRKPEKEAIRKKKTPILC